MFACVCEIQWRDDWEGRKDSTDERVANDDFNSVVMDERGKNRQEPRRRKKQSRDNKHAKR